MVNTRSKQFDEQQITTNIVSKSGQVIQDG